MLDIVHCVRQPPALNWNWLFIAFTNKTAMYIICSWISNQITLHHQFINIQTLTLSWCRMYICWPFLLQFQFIWFNCEWIFCWKLVLVNLYLYLIIQGDVLHFFTQNWPTFLYQKINKSQKNCNLIENCNVLNYQ